MQQYDRSLTPLSDLAGLLQQAKAGEGVAYKTVPDQATAQQLLTQLQNEGRLGVIQPIGRDGMYGWEVRHWAR